MGKLENTIINGYQPMITENGLVERQGENSYNIGFKGLGNKLINYGKKGMAGLTALAVIGTSALLYNPKTADAEGKVFLPIANCSFGNGNGLDCGFITKPNDNKNDLNNLYLSEVNSENEFISWVKKHPYLTTLATACALAVSYNVLKKDKNESAPAPENTGGGQGGDSPD